MLVGMNRHILHPFLVTLLIIVLVLNIATVDLSHVKRATVC
jgi:hypothetical protein